MIQIEGDSGLGKTALLQRAAALARASSLRVIVEAARGASAPPPDIFHPL